MALLTLTIFMLTSLLSALIGLIFVTAIHPGRDLGNLVSQDKEPGQTPSLVDTFLDLVR